MVAFGWGGYLGFRRLIFEDFGVQFGVQDTLESGEGYRTLNPKPSCVGTAALEVEAFGAHSRGALGFRLPWMLVAGRSCRSSEALHSTRLVLTGFLLRNLI